MMGTNAERANRVKEKGDQLGSLLEIICTIAVGCKDCWGWGTNCSS